MGTIIYSLITYRKYATNCISKKFILFYFIVKRAYSILTYIIKTEIKKSANPCPKIIWLPINYYNIDNNKKLLHNYTFQNLLVC